MQEFIAQFGDFAPIIYLLLASILPIFLFPPGIFSAVGGYLFGFTHGFILSIISAMIYTSAMFFISRYFASDYVEKYLAKKLTKKQYDTIFGISENKLTIFLIIYRLIPVLPNSVICYSYGLTKISFKKYLIGNIIGLIPGKMIGIKCPNPDTRNQAQGQNKRKKAIFIIRHSHYLRLSFIQIYVDQLDTRTSQ